MSTQNLVDYSTTFFTETYELDGAKYYATFHQDLYSEMDEVDEESELDSTGRIFVVMSHPQGLLRFFMDGKGGHWEIEKIIKSSTKFRDIKPTRHAGKDFLKNDEITIPLDGNDSQSDEAENTEPQDSYNKLFIGEVLKQWLSQQIIEHDLLNSLCLKTS